jgi:hypothetical protein
MRDERPDLAAKATQGELPVLPWRGGVEKPPKSNRKTGSMKYFAMWSGLRGDDLDIDLATDQQLTCSRTGVVVTYTISDERLLQAADEQSEE